ncbi:DUF3857 domain-containing protein [Robertkochia aurantiaca]|uniref:DUF3857 domain-containing protein n=1 Tax=Robertkochia aurantiaca TaxID=2873700 RepID=UPI001CC9F12F|nr:DUF3857 domain-containing protein [Robertkochia sp. 3YJGBD-33]
MNKLLFSIVLFILVPGQFLSAQDFDFGKVSLEEVREKQHPVEPEAEAAWLYRKRETYFLTVGGGIQQYTEVHNRLKVYTKEGFDYATIELILLNDAEKLGGLKAYSYNEEDGNLKEMKLDKDQVFTEEYNKNFKKVKFALPEVKEGTVIEYKYKISSDFITRINPFAFQFGIPVNKLSYRFSAPDFMQFKPQYRGYLGIFPNQTSAYNAGIGQNVNIHEYDRENIPSLKVESFVDNINNYRAAAMYELNIVNIPGKYYKSYSQTWNDVTKSIYDYDEFGSELKKNGYFNEDLNRALQGATTSEEKVSRIFNFVRDKMTWNEYFGYWCDLGVRKAYKENTGNVADINLMLTAMLRHAGLKANPVLTSTKSHGIPLFPTTDGFNYVICHVELPGKSILLDATDKHALPNVLPLRSLNWNGRLVREDGTSADIDLSAPQQAAKMVTLMVDLKEDGSLEGMMRQQLTHHEAYRFRQNHLNKSEDLYLEEMENKLSGILIGEYSRDNMEDHKMPLVESFKFTQETTAEFSGNKMLLSPMLFFAEDENPFKLEKREFPVDFLYPKITRIMVNLNIPENFTIEHLPESTAVLLPDNLGKFTFNVAVNGSRIQLVVSSEINTDIVPADYYEALRSFFDLMVKKETEKIVLVKV